MNIVIEKLARTNGEKVELSCDLVKSELLTATTIAKSGTFEKPAADMGDVIHVNDKMFLVEADLTVTEIEQDEYAYYKRIDTKDRVAQWFEGSLN